MTALPMIENARVDSIKLRAKTPFAKFCVRIAKSIRNTKTASGRIFPRCFVTGIILSVKNCFTASLGLRSPGPPGEEPSLREEFVLLIRVFSDFAKENGDPIVLS